MRKPCVSRVVPMFNEELNIKHAIEAVVEACASYADDCEIIIVVHRPTTRTRGSNGPEPRSTPSWISFPTQHDRPL